MRARSALFTLFGDVVLPAGGEAWLQTITESMGTLGFTPEAVRTALHRMTAEGWVEPRREGRYAAYRLTERGVARLEEAAGRIYRLRSTAWDGQWHVLISSALAGDEGLKAELAWIGYGRLEASVWVSPHDHSGAVSQLLGDLEGAVTQLRGASSTDDVDLARRAWDLASLRAKHEAFLAEWAGGDTPRGQAEAFATRLRLVHEWRSFLFLDPGLPEAVLPNDWPGHAAAEVFKTIYESLLKPSWAFYRALLDAAPAPTTATTTIEPDANPFAQGLAALGRPRPHPLPFATP